MLSKNVKKVKKKSKKTKQKNSSNFFLFFLFFLFLIGVAIFDWEWGRNSAPRDGQKSPCVLNISIIREYQTPSYIKVDRPIDMFPRF